MNFSKLLCLVLVYSQQLGQVLVEEIKECEAKTPGTPVPCNGKKGGARKLKVKKTIATNEPDVKWEKDAALESDNTKYKIDGGKKETLEILSLDVPDEGEYTAKNISPEEKFQVKVVDCLGGKTASPGLCQGKLGGIIKLGLSDGTVDSISWKKGTGDLSADNSKYPGGVDKATLTIKNLDDEDEAKFTGGANGEGEHFSVQVADCFGGGAGKTVECNGKQGKNLKLRISGSVTSGSVTWAKEGGELPDGHDKKGTKDEGLQLKTLAPPDAGTYTATYAPSVTESFTVKIAEPKASDGTTKKAPTTGGGGGDTTDKVIVHDKKPDGGSGSSVLSYSPALLVTVTLMHLLLQLAA
ncbi:uncharacterized protein [Syngnathus scovelli]|uniref:uncharacterized protein n=1 Tax=Syngnathus scovelli TaxID=161590 RepID=UPI00210FAECA|nr:uncharacterized protein LOC125968821 [Syngnathus scovelli]